MDDGIEEEVDLAGAAGRTGDVERRLVGAVAVELNGAGVVEPACSQGRFCGQRLEADADDVCCW